MQSAMLTSGFVSVVVARARAARRTLHVGATAVLLLASASYAQVLKQVPADAPVVIKVNNLKGVSGKLAALAKAWGIDQMQPALSDPLTALKQQMNISKGLNDGGDMAFAVINFPDETHREPAFLMLIPVSDYQAFLGNFQGVQTEGDVATFSFPNDPSPSYGAHWGDYAAITNSRGVLNQKPAGLNPTGLSAKELSGKDIVWYANMPALRAKALPQLQQHRDAWIADLEKQLNAKPESQQYVPVAKAVANQAIDLAQSFLSNCDGATFGLSLSPAGIGTTLLADFKPDSPWAKNLAKVKVTDNPLVHGLPDGKYLLYAGLIQNPQLTTQLFDDFAKPLTDQLNQLGDQGKDVVKLLDAVKAQWQNTTGFSLGLLAPANAGQGSLVQSVAVVRGQAKQIVAGAKQISQSQQALMLAVQPNAPAHQTITPNAKTIDGVQFDEFKTEVTGQANSPREAQAEQMMNFIYGPNGQQAYVGAIDDNHALAVSGLDDATISKAIAAAKADKPGLTTAAPVQAVEKQLAQNRFFAAYIPLDNVISTAAAVANQRAGMQVHLQLKPDLQPIGITGATEANAIRFDSYIPSELIQNLISAGMQAAGGMQRQQNPNANQPDNAGGL